MAASEPREAPTRPLVVRILRALLGVLLLFGPLVAAELALHRQTTWLRPVLRGYTGIVELKGLLFAQREHCPDLVTFGTSVTDHALPSPDLAGRKIAGKKIRRPFDFASPELRATNILAQYRWIRDQGCKPRWIAVEVSPIVINGEHGGVLHDPQYMSALAQLGMPKGWTQVRDYGLAEQLELATYDRLLLYRIRANVRRRALSQLELESWAVSRDEWAKLEDKAMRERKEWPKWYEPKYKLEYDGKITRQAKALTASKWRQEALERKRAYKRGRYRYAPNRPEKDALLTLAREASAAGITVIFQAPPMSSLYREMEPKLGMDEDYRVMAAELDALARELDAVVFIDHHSAPDYTHEDFQDWIHLSRGGAKRYVEALLADVSKALAAESEGT